MNWILVAAVLGCAFNSLTATLLPQQQDIPQPASWDSVVNSVIRTRQRREIYNPIEECLTVTSKDGHFHYKATSKEMLETTCGLFFITDPERQVEIEITHIDVSCDDGGLVSIVDGWELNGEYFPSPEDHQLPLEQRVISECGSRQVKRRYVSSQNAALVQFRVPTLLQGFILRVRYINNLHPCNILVEGTSHVYSVTNYGRRINCSVTTLFPASISVISVDVGNSETDLMSRSPLHIRLKGDIAAKKGISHRCDEKGMLDYLQIGGSSGLDTANIVVVDSVCGLGRDLKTIEKTIACGITTVRLVSSGRHRNKAQIAIRSAEPEEVSSADMMCGR